MKIKITALFLFVVVLPCILAGCACEHEWTDATCLTPKTCTLCQEVEGEALGHSWEEATCTAPKTCTSCGETDGETLSHVWVEANYQDPKTCSGCGTTEGEPLLADFEKYGLETIKPEVGKEYDYVTSCYGNAKKTTVGKLIIEKYQTTDGEGRLSPKEGYEWKIIRADITFGDKNANRYGMSILTPTADYYKIEAWEPGMNEYTANLHGCIETVPVWVIYDNFSKWKNDECHYTIEIAFQVPKNYDGVVFAFCNAALRQDGEVYIQEMVDEDSLLFRLD